jgi:hypothetical protein
MRKFKKPGMLPEFSAEEGLALALSYLKNPGDVLCPHCGPDVIEVLHFLECGSIEDGEFVVVSPDGEYPDADYVVVLYCNWCGRAAAIDLSADEPDEDFA